MGENVVCLWDHRQRGRGEFNTMSPNVAVRFDGRKYIWHWNGASSVVENDYAFSIHIASNYYHNHHGSYTLHDIWRRKWGNLMTPHWCCLFGNFAFELTAGVGGCVWEPIENENQNEADAWDFRHLLRQHSFRLEMVDCQLTCVGFSMHDVHVMIWRHVLDIRKCGSTFWMGL